MTQPVVVHHALGSYPVYVEAGALGRMDQMVAAHLAGRRIAMIADESVFQLYQNGTMGAAPWTGDTITFPSGERSKTRESWTRLTDSLMERGFGRDSALVALGGGVAGDLAGFVAATYMRGIPYIQVPTTLLAMVDASVGGKTGVDTPHGKNLVGAFHPPAAVIADPQVLATLPDRDYRAGLAEAVKHGLIADRSYFEWIESNAAALSSRALEPLTHLIRRSVEIKAEVVSGDERESGRRAILNAGHTVAHALERISGYEVLHGQAVAVGLVVECELAEQLGVAPAGLRHRVETLLGRLGLAASFPPRLERGSLFSSMATDKKNRSGQVHFALVRKVGEMHRDEGWTTPVSGEAIDAALATLE
jgi:3-dehydroquinate synthase